jgi:SAM-dependent methyltransferase
VNSAPVKSTTATVGALHEKLVFGRRVKVLARHLAALIPPRAKVLDVGCGDGTLDQLILQQLPGVSIEGIDVLVRTATKIPVRPFDGMRIPYPDARFDVVMFVDVLHHTDDPLLLLQEAQRVGKTILVKDHFRKGLLAGPTLRLMDWVGNAHHGVVLPYNYWSEKQWDDALRVVGLKSVEKIASLGLYPPPASWIFERRLHFISRFVPTPAHDQAV